MTKEVATVHKLTDAVKMKVLAMMARGDKYKTIQEWLQRELNITYSSNGLSMLRKRNSAVIATIEATVMNAEAAEAERIRSKSLRMLSRRLQRASSDELEIEDLDEKYRNGELELPEYKRKKHGLLELSIKDLTQVSSHMYNQTKDGPGGPGDGGGLPQTPSPVDARAAEIMMNALRNGDTITLQQMTVQRGADVAPVEPETV